MISDKIRILFLFNVVFLAALSVYCLIVGMPFALSALELYGSLIVMYGAAILLTMIKPLAWTGRAIMLAVLLGWFCLNATALQTVRMQDGFITYDGFFVVLDSFTGYSWREASMFVAERPLLASILHLSYTTTIQQVLLLFGFLMLLRSQNDAARMIFCNGLALTFCVAIWCVIPNLGPSAYTDLPPDIGSKAKIIADNGYGAVMNDFARHGIERIDFDKVLGMVAFPSYHTVLTCLILYFAYSIRVLFWFALPVHLITIPAILITGGHLVIDLIAGVGVFVMALKTTDTLLRIQLSPRLASMTPGPLKPMRADGKSIFKFRDTDPVESR